MNFPLRRPIDIDTVALTSEGKKAVGAGVLNKAQAVSAYSESQQTLTLGPPGTGKTKTLVERIVWLLGNGVDHNEIFGASFTTGASRELIERAKARYGRLPPASKMRTFGTFNSLGGRLLVVLAPRAGYGQLVDGSNLRLIRGGEIALAKRLGIDVSRGKRSRENTSALFATTQQIDVRPTAADLGWHGAGFGGDDLIDMQQSEGKVLANLLEGKKPAAFRLGRVHDLPFLDLVGQWQERLIFPDDAIRIAEGDDGACVPDEILAKRAHDYKKYKEAMYSDGFCDFSDQVVLPVKILRENEELRTVIQGRFKDVIVDEKQDANTALGALVDILAGGTARLWAVGDPDQTLYAFRGSDPTGILGFQGRWPRSQVVALTQNYRSRPTIIEAANKLIRNNKDRFETSMTATRDQVNLAPAIAKALSTPNLRYPAHLVRLNPIEVVTYPDDETEALDVARKIRELLAAGVDPAQIAVLFRSGFRGYFLGQALRGLGVRVRLLRGAERGEPAESDLVEGMLRAVYFKGQIAMPGDPVADAIRKQLGYGDRLIRVSANVARLKGEGLADPDRWLELIEAVREVVGGEGRFEGQDLDSEGPSLRWVLRVGAACRAARDRGSYSAWAASAPIAGKTDAADGGADGVMITTLASIHGVKGLEYDHVFLPGLEGDICPDGGDLANEEERRLFYVALTRAKESVTASWAPRRAGNRIEMTISPYVEEAFKGTPKVTWIDYGVLGEEGASPATIAPAVIHSAPAPAELARPQQPESHSGDGVVRFHLLIDGGGDVAVWRLRLLNGRSQTVMDELVNPNGDYFGAMIEAQHQGVAPETLEAAPGLDEILGKLQAVLAAVESTSGKDARIIAAPDAAAAIGIGGWAIVELQAE